VYRSDGERNAQKGAIRRDRGSFRRKFLFRAKAMIDIESPESEIFRRRDPRQDGKQGGRIFAAGICRYDKSTRTDVQVLEE